MLKTIRSILLVLSLYFIAVVPQNATAETDATATILAPFRNAVYNHDLNRIEIIQEHQSIQEQIIRANLSPAETMYARSMANYYFGRYYHALKSREEMATYASDLRKGRYLALRKYYYDREDSLHAYRQARSAAELYLELNPGAEAHSLLGEILGQMLFLGNVAQALSLGPKSRRQIKIALELDPDNHKALIQEASRLAYSPAIYGGKPEKARELYRKILQSGNNNKEDVFNIYGGFAMAAFMEKDDQRALLWFRKALDLYPGNIFAQGMIDYLLKENH